MSADDKTIDFYDARAKDYADVFTRDEPDATLTGFMNALPPGGRVLDLGCGPGNSAALMAAAGFQVEATDATPAMVEMARSRYGLNARVETFAELTAKAVYDGIWANFSLLHADQADIPMHIFQINEALKPGGLFHLGMKLGDGEARDELGRFYSYYSEEKLTNLLENYGFAVVHRQLGSGKGMAGTDDPFIIIRARKDG